MLQGKTIILGVSGSIAAYKAAEIVSGLKKAEAGVKVIMTKGACEFITPLTLQTLSQNPVASELFLAPKNWEVEHIALADEADLFLLAPCTANVIGKLANGIADDLLTSTVMATRAPVFLAPAMNVKMYENPVTQHNLARLKQYGYREIEPEYGVLACGYQGKGRLAKVEDILQAVKSFFRTKEDLKGRTVLITAGATREAIDPVRYLTNRSTGKMGYALAKAAYLRGAEVKLVSGPSALKVPFGVEHIPVESARDMYKAVMAHFPECDLIIKAAAVADYRPVAVACQKVKKKSGIWSLELERNPDILYELGQNKGSRILVGFAAETENLLANAKGKIAKKNLDFIVANDLTVPGAGFGVDTNIVRIIDRSGRVEDYPQMSKFDLAGIILDKAAALLNIDRKN